MGARCLNGRALFKWSFKQTSAFALFECHDIGNAGISGIFLHSNRPGESPACICLNGISQPPYLTGVEMKDRRISDTQARRKIAEIIRLSRAVVAAGFRNPVEDYDHGLKTPIRAD
jgi:hypothetical protein